MRLTFFVVTLFCIVAVVRSCTFNPFQPLSQDCYNQNPMKPYCLLANNATPSCFQCYSDCDCDIGQFCSSAPDTQGTCVGFLQLGAACLPYTQSQLTDPSISNTYKCASLYNQSGILQVDHAGVCVDGVCRQCLASDTPVNPPYYPLFKTCYGYEGTNAARQCAFPGVLVPTIRKWWQPGETVRQPVFTWLAVFFPFILLQLILSILILVCHKPRVYEKF
jgi:hypothetical protein